MFRQQDSGITDLAHVVSCREVNAGFDFNNPINFTADPAQTIYNISKT